jgi:amino acid transporter
MSNGTLVAPPVYDAEPEVDERSRSGRTHLRANALGVAGLLFFVLSAQAPLTGIAGASPIAMVLGNGTGAPGAYLLSGLVIVLFAVGYIAMSRHVVNAGAFYAYIGEGLGRRLGSGSALVAVTAYATVQAAMYGLYGVVVSGLAAQHLGVSIEWWIPALVTMALVQVLGVLGIDVGARVLALLVLAETSILLLFDVVVLVRGGGPQGISVSASFSPSQVFSGAPGVALMFAVASMFGFESTAIYAEEAKRPEKTVPRATYMSVALITGFFAFTTWMFVSSYGASQAVGQAGKALQGGDSTAFVFQAMAAELGGWTNDVLPFLLATSLLAGILAFHNSINRYLFALSRDSVLPTALDRVNRQGSPWAASLVQTTLAIVLVMPFAILGKDPVLTLFSWFSGVAVLGVMVLYFLTSVGVVRFFRRTKVDRRPWQTLVAPVLASLAIAVVVWLIVSNFTTLIGGSKSTALWLILGVPAAFVVGLALDLRARRPGRATDAPALQPDLP